MMNDIFISSKDIEQASKELQSIGENLNLKLSLFAQYIKYIFSKIATCKTIEEATGYLGLLDKIQSALAELVFKYEIGVSTRLRRFISDFDNLEQDAKYYFDKIQSGEYTF